MSTPDGGLVLALAFALLATRRSGIALGLMVAQAVVLAVAAALLGHEIEAAVLLLLNGAALPWLLYGLSSEALVRRRIGLVPCLCAGAVLTLLAAPSSVPLAVLLLGILLATAVRDRMMQVLGLLAMQNGIALAGLGLPAPERLAAVLPMIPALAWAALWMSQRRPA